MAVMNTLVSCLVVLIHVMKESHLDLPAKLLIKRKIEVTFAIPGIAKVTLIF